MLLLGFAFLEGLTQCHRWQEKTEMNLCQTHSRFGYERNRRGTRSSVFFCLSKHKKKEKPVQVCLICPVCSDVHTGFYCSSHVLQLPIFLSTSMSSPLFVCVWAVCCWNRKRWMHVKTIVIFQKVKPFYCIWIALIRSRWISCTMNGSYTALWNARSLRAN